LVLKVAVIPNSVAGFWRTGVRDLLFGLRMSHIYCVYTLASRSRNLYTGVTDNLERRMIEHREGLVPGFTVRYRIFRLVHFEEFGDIGCAIAREKEIKGWRREKKVWMIERKNPTWVDLAEGLPGKGQMDKREADVHHRAKAATSKSRSLTPVRQRRATGFGMTAMSAWKRRSGVRKYGEKRG
jgi:putative endonuclease